MHLWFKVGPQIPAWRTYTAVSTDEGESWSEPAPLVPGDAGGRGPVKNKPLILGDGAWLAGAFRAESGLEHALAQRVRQTFLLDHARTHAVFLPYAVAYNRDAAPAAIARVAKILGVEDAAQGLYDLNVRLGLTTGLKELGMPESGLERAADAVAGAKFSNPRPADRSDLFDVVTQAFHGLPPR